VLRGYVCGPKAVKVPADANTPEDAKRNPRSTITFIDEVLKRSGRPTRLPLRVRGDMFLPPWDWKPAAVADVGGIPEIVADTSLIILPLSREISLLPLA
jgi:hypothetical protein